MQECCKQALYLIRNNIGFYANKYSKSNNFNYFGRKARHITSILRNTVKAYNI